MIDSNQKLDQLLPLLEKGFAFDLETTPLDPQDADIVAISITASLGISFVIDCRQTEPLQTDLFNFDEQKKFHPLFERLIPLFEDDGVPKILHNAKYEHQVLSYHNIHLKGIHFDTMLAAHLIDSRQSIGLKELAKSIFDFEMVEFDALMKDVSSILELDVKLLASYVADDSNVTYHLYEQFDQMLSGKLRSLFLDLEMPLVNVLSDMELAGVQCDINYSSFIEGL